MVLNVSTDRVGLMDFEKIDKCYKFGYECVMQSKELKSFEKVDK